MCTHLKYRLHRCDTNERIHCWPRRLPSIRQPCLFIELSSGNILLWLPQVWKTHPEYTATHWKVLDMIVKAIRASMLLTSDPFVSRPWKHGIDSRATFSVTVIHSISNAMLLYVNIGYLDIFTISGASVCITKCQT